MIDVERYETALKRSLNEIRFAISMRHAYNKMCHASGSFAWGFYGYASIALFNDSFSHTIKVLDEHKDVSAFWYIYSADQEIAESAFTSNSVDLEKIREASKALRIIRNKTHFHIDKHRVKDSPSVWKQAGISGDLFSYTQDGVWAILNTIYSEYFGELYRQPIYAGEDVHLIIESARDSGIEV